jgi:hypothetical protein
MANVRRGRCTRSPRDHRDRKGRGDEGAANPRGALRRHGDRAVRSPARGLSALEALPRAGGRPTRTDVSQRADLPPSTTHRLLATLDRIGHVYRTGEPGRWYAGLQSFAVGSTDIGRIRARHRRQPFSLFRRGRKGRCAETARTISDPERPAAAHFPISGAMRQRRVPMAYPPPSLPLLASSVHRRQHVERGRCAARR